MKNKIWWVHYWPMERDVRMEREDGTATYRRLSHHQGKRLVSVIEGLVENGVGYMMLPVAEPCDWVWTSRRKWADND